MPRSIPARLAQEVALLAERADVTEELVRLASHLEQARALVTGSGASGRRLEFLVQEIGRELNTIGSKSAVDRDQLRDRRGESGAREGTRTGAERGMMAAVTDRRGVLVIVSSPSGAGKTTLTRRLLEEFAGQLEFSVSYTTRPMRNGEVDGRDYWFVSTDEFRAAWSSDHEFAEYAYVHGNRYGTAQAPVEAALAAGRDIIFDVDCQGGAALSSRWPKDSLKIFILPPSIEALETRLRQRATDATDVIERRLRKAREELEHFNEYQHLIVNDDLERAYAVLRAIYLTRRYGMVDRPDVPYPLAQLAAFVAENRESEAHARQLVER